MKSAEEILDGVILELMKDTSSRFMALKDLKKEPEYILTIQAMREYAAQAINAQLEVAANEAEVYDYPEANHVNPESITGCTRIELR